MAGADVASATALVQSSAAMAGVLTAAKLPGTADITANAVKPTAVVATRPDSGAVTVTDDDGFFALSKVGIGVIIIIAVAAVCLVVVGGYCGKGCGASDSAAPAAPSAATDLEGQTAGGADYSQDSSSVPRTGTPKRTSRAQLSSVPPAVGGGRAAKEEAYDTLFAQYDKNQDGVLDRQEVEAMIKSVRGVSGMELL